MFEIEIVGKTCSQYSTALFTKPLSNILPVAGRTLRDHSSRWPHSGLRDFQELSQPKSHGMTGNHEAGSFVNSAVNRQYSSGCLHLVFVNSVFLMPQIEIEIPASD